MKQKWSKILYIAVTKLLISFHFLKYISCINISYYMFYILLNIVIFK